MSLTQVTSDVISTNTISGLISIGFNTLNVATTQTQTIDFGTGNTLVFRANTSLERMRITTGGSVGIGTAAPGHALEVYGSSKFINVNDSTTATGRGFLLQQANTNFGGLISYGSTHASVANEVSLKNYTANGALTFHSNNTERMRIANTGRVGIATTTPQTTLDVFGTIQANSVTVTANTVVPDLKAFQVTSPDRHTIRPSLLLDFANSKVLDPRITFTRASTGTYYDGKTVAKAEENLNTYSQAFTNAIWGTTSATVVDNNATAPDGTTTAALLTATAGTNAHGFNNSGLLVSGTPYTMSVFVKAGTHNFVGIGGNNGLGGATFNLSTQTVITGSGTITSAGSGWYRISTYVNAGGARGVFFGLTDASGNSNFTAAGTETAYFWGAQAEQRNALTAYTVTTTAPITNYIPVLLTASANTARFEHNPVTGESLGLEIEEARTNLFLRSEEFDNVSWNVLNLTRTANTIIAPDGTLTGDKIIVTTTNGVHSIYQSLTATAAAHTQTVYAKAGEYSWLTISMDGSNFVYFDLANGTLGTVGTNHTATITAVGNGWYRCSATQTFASSGTKTVYFNVASANGTASFAGDGYKGVYIWGAQLEAGSFATSYIPTVASTVARSADTVEITNLTSIIQAGQVDTTVYCEARKGTKDDGIIYGLVDSTGTFNQSLYSNPNFNAGSSNPSLLFNGVGQFSGAVSFTGNTIKTAFAFKNNDMQQAVNGTTSATDTSGRIPQYTKLTIGQSPWGYDNHVNGYISKLAIYPKRLTNAELQGLTTI